MIYIADINKDSIAALLINIVNIKNVIMTPKKYKTNILYCNYSVKQ